MRCFSKASLLAAAVLLSSIPSVAQTSAPPSSDPRVSRSALGVLLAREGSLIVSRRASIGKIGEKIGESSCSTDVYAVRAWAVGAESHTLTGLQFVVTEGETSNQGILDYAEIAGVTKALEFMERTVTETRSGGQGAGLTEETAVAFQSRDGFMLRVFGGPAGFRASASVETIPTVSCGFFAMRLKELRQIVNVGQLWLDQK